MVACSDAAAERGVRVGMSVAEATGLRPKATSRRRTQPLGWHKVDSRADRAALEGLALWCRRFSPLVRLEEADPPEGLLLDVTGCERFFRGEDNLVEQLVGGLSRQGLRTRVAGADTLGAAWGIARYAPFDGWIVVPPGQVRVALRPAPIEALRLPGETVTRLHELGITSIGQLERLPREALASRFGLALLERLDQSMGLVAEPVGAEAPESPVQADWKFEEPTERRDALRAVCERLLEPMVRTLAKRHHGIRQLQVRLDLRDAVPVRFAIDLFAPRLLIPRLMELLALRLETLKLTAPVTALALRVSVSEPLEVRQEDLFARADERERPKRLAELIERLSNRLGPDAVLRSRLVPDAQPEHSCRYEPILESAAARRPSSRPEPSSQRPRRPTRLRRRPIPLTMVSVAPDGPPIRIVRVGAEERLRHAWGPERIETGWWRGQHVRRDYYVVETVAGERLWVFRRLDDQRWFLHGEFD